MRAVLPISALLLTLATPARAAAPSAAPSAAPFAANEQLTEGHEARLLTTGRASFAARNHNIDRADVVLYKTYAFLDDETGRETVASLVSRARAGAQVFVEYDVKGTLHSIPNLLRAALGMKSVVPRHLQPLVDAGVVLIPTNTPRLGSIFLGRDHDKILITWTRGEAARVIMGGMNVGDTYRWSGPWRNQRVPTVAFRDTDVELTGPETARAIFRFVEGARAAKSTAVPALRRQVLDLIGNGGATAGPERPDTAARFVRNNPKLKDSRRRIEQLYEQLIDETPAGETVTLSNAYMLPPARLRKAILRAAQRGVKFRLLVNAADVPEREARLVALAFRDQLRVLLKKAPPGSIEVIEWSGNPRRNEGAIHQKIAKFGSKGPVLAGSANLDPLSANHNSETVLVVKNKRVSQQFDALINRALREGKTRRLDAATLRRDSLGVKIKGFFLNRVAGRVL